MFGAIAAAVLPTVIGAITSSNKGGNQEGGGGLLSLLDPLKLFTGGGAKNEEPQATPESREFAQLLMDVLRGEKKKQEDDQINQMLDTKMAQRSFAPPEGSYGSQAAFA